MKTICEICGAPAHGHHFGSTTCRACSAFFRRALLTKSFRRSCKFEKNCTDFIGLKYPPCKPCRLKKCLQKGMDSKNLRNAPPMTIFKSLYLSLYPESSKEVSFISTSSNRRSFVDVHSLVSRGFELLDFGAPRALNPSLTHLQKMALASSESSGKLEKVSYISRQTGSSMWEWEFLSTAKWLTHFEEFTSLPKGIQMQLLQSIWHVWGRWSKIARSAELRKRQRKMSRNLQLYDHFYVEFENVTVDTSWLSRHPLERIRCFMDVSDTDWKMEPFIQAMASMDLSKVELAFMSAQLCFQYAQNRFIGTEISSICEKFLEVISNDLHSHYMDTGFGDMKNYAGKLAQMLKINRGILGSIRELREMTKVAHTFDIFIADFSHPEIIRQNLSESQNPSESIRTSSESIRIHENLAIHRISAFIRINQNLKFRQNPSKYQNPSESIRIHQNLRERATATAA